MDESELFREYGYSIEGLIESDEWGELYRARYVPHDREVLLRSFPDEVSREAGSWKLLLAEIQAWARLDHPGVLRVLDWGETLGGNYVSTAVPAGEPLGVLLSQDRGTDGADEIFANLLLSVEAARQWGVLHLGLGPTNIWVSQEGGVEVGEFGFWYVARDFPGLGTGRCFFPAPEQISGERTSAATDVYALGLIYLSLRFGVDCALAAARGCALPVELGEMQTVISRCLERQPLARYLSAGELARALDLRPEEWLYEEYRECPLCRLKEEIQRETTGGEWTVPYAGRADGQEPPWTKYVWIAMILLALAVALLWWLALR